MFNAFSIEFPWEDILSKDSKDWYVNCSAHWRSPPFPIESNFACYQFQRRLSSSKNQTFSLESRFDWRLRDNNWLQSRSKILNGLGPVIIDRAVVNPGTEPTDPYRLISRLIHVIYPKLNTLHFSSRSGDTRGRGMNLIMFTNCEPRRNESGKNSRFHLRSGSISRCFHGVPRSV